MQTIPEWVMQNIFTAFFGFLGWVGHIAYCHIKNAIKPFKQDKERFEKIISSIDPYTIEYFTKADIEHFSDLHAKNISKMLYKIDDIQKKEKSCRNKALKRNEFKLHKALDDLNTFISHHSRLRTYK